mmetsp:Transcript_32495/g.58309  ORF Transcript_32495/g.58309 Transcript_32495/m.58309 type:complete len:84 (+) Transcript_32495:325-576(+)
MFALSIVVPICGFNFSGYFNHLGTCKQRECMKIPANLSKKGGRGHKCYQLPTFSYSRLRLQLLTMCLFFENVTGEVNPEVGYC